MSSGYKEYYVQLINSRTKQAIDDDSGVYNVLTADSPVELTIYSNDQGSSQSNPGTMTDGVIQFWTANTVTSVDLSIYTANGEAVFVQALTPSQHRVEVDVDKLEQTLVLPFAASEAETSTGFTLAASTLIEDIDLLVSTVDDTETMDVGTDGTTTNDPNGLIAAASVATAGLVDLGAIVTSGSNEDYFSSCTLGALLADFLAGTDVATDVGTFRRIKTFIGSAETDANITYTGSSGTDTAAGYIILTLKKLL